VADPEVVAGVLRIHLGDLTHGPNARGDLGDVAALANSLRTLGQQQPLLVEPLPDGRWSVMDGNRRLKAARHAGLTHILAIPRKTPLTEQQRTLRQLAMHSTAKTFDPMAEARAVEWLMFADGGPHMSREEIAEALSKSTGWVKGRIDLLQLAPDEQESVVKGTLTVGAALQALAARRGGPPRTAPPVVHCDKGGRCGCICHKRNQATNA
jgi:ParB family transcriptional regulator, chromosome partitioning protein